jgi:hypothetical protein
MRVKVFRTTDVVLFCAMVGAAAFTYITKHEAENTLDRIREIQRKIVFERDSIDVLKADWALLTQPNRIQMLADRFQSELKLDNVEAHQIATIDQLPERPLRIEDITSAPFLEAAGTATDKTVTGGIGR